VKRILPKLKIVEKNSIFNSWMAHRKEDY